MELTSEERHQMYLYEESWGDPTVVEAQQVQAGIGGSLTPEELAILYAGREERIMPLADMNSRDSTRISEIIPKVIAKVGAPAVVALLADYGAKEGADLDPVQYTDFLIDCEMMLRQGKSLIEAAQFLADTAPTPEYREIVDRVVDQLVRLEQAGMKFVLVVAHRGDWIPIELKESRGLVWRGWRSNRTRVYIQGADVRGYVGTSYQTVLHELIHAVTQAAIYVGIRKPSDGTTGTLGDELNTIHGVAVSHLRGRIDSGATLTPVEHDLNPRGKNIFCDPDDFLTWGLNWHEMQHYLEGISYKGKTLWNAFVDTIRRFLGLSGKADSALSELLRIAVSRRGGSIMLVTVRPHMTRNDPGGDLTSN